MIIRARAPLRLGFAGGGTDVAPFCDMHGGFILNATIDKHAYAILEPRTDRKLRFVAADQSLQWEGHADDDCTLGLHMGVYRRIARDFQHSLPDGLTLTTYTDAPPGSGLGSSSTLVVAMVKAFVELLNLPLGEYEIAHLAYEIERIDLGLNGGKQDQYAATFGGFNFMEFYDDDRVVVNPLRIKNWIISELEASLILYYTGVSRSSASIIDEQAAKVRNGDRDSVAAMFTLKEEAVSMKESLLRGDLERFAASLDASWRSKKRIAEKITTPLIDTAYDTARNAGAMAGKVSGAGGGGFMIFLADPTHRMAVMRALDGLGGQVSGCHFTKHGTQGWRI
jgi:D-glycero-alpha-D-manno-heptose-7-phosphate kinase